MRPENLLQAMTLYARLSEEFPAVVAEAKKQYALFLELSRVPRVSYMAGVHEFYDRSWRLLNSLDSNGALLCELWRYEALIKDNKE